MPGLAAAIGANPYLFLIAERIAHREFNAADAMALIRYSDLSRDQTGAHPGPHVSLTAPARARDFHIQGTKYANRALPAAHTMFRTEQQAADSVAQALNTEAGAAAVNRLRHLRLGNRAVLFSRSGAIPASGVIRSANAGGAAWIEGQVQFVTLVLDHSGDGQLVLITAYPNLAGTPGPRLEPPAGADMLESPRGTYALFWGVRQPSP